MILIAGITFFASLLLICFLFAVKVREIETGRVIAPRFHEAADREALHLKGLLLAAHLDLKKVPPLMLHWLHVVLHFIALKFARVARSASLAAHAFATFVSQKRYFERRRSGSELLRKMSERRKEHEERNGHEGGERVEF